MAIRNQYAPRREADPGAVLSLRQQALDQQAEMELLRMEQANRARQDAQRFALLQTSIGQDFAREREAANFEQRRQLGAEGFEQQRQLAAEAEEREFARDQELQRRGFQGEKDLVEWKYDEETRQKQATLNRELAIIDSLHWSDEEKEAARQMAYAKAGDPRERPVLRQPQHPSGYEPGTFFYDEHGSLMTVQQDGNVKQLKPGLRPADLVELMKIGVPILTRREERPVMFDGEPLIDPKTGEPVMELVDVPPSEDELQAWLDGRVRGILGVFRPAAAEPAGAAPPDAAGAAQQPEGTARATTTPAGIVGRGGAAGGRAGHSAEATGADQGAHLAAVEEEALTLARRIRSGERVTPEEIDRLRELRAVIAEAQAVVRARLEEIEAAYPDRNYPPEVIVELRRLAEGH